MIRGIWSRIREESELWLRAAPPGIMMLVAIVIHISGGLQPLEWMLLDTILRLRPQEKRDERIIIVGIEERDIQSIGKYPIPDGKIAELLNKLETYKPRVIGLDLFKNVPVEPGSEQLKQVFQNNNNIIGIEKILPPGEIPPHKNLSSEQVGFADLRIDKDGKNRRYLLYTPSPRNIDEDKYSLGLQLVNQYFSAEGTDLETGIKDPNTIMIRGKELPQISQNFGGYVDIDDGGLSILMNFRNSRKPFHVVSMSDILNEKVDAQLLRDRIILIGNRNMSAGDIFYTSALPSFKLSGQVYGVDYHAHAVSQILSYVVDNRPMMRSWGDVKEYIWIAIWAFVSIMVGRIARSAYINILSIAVLNIILFIFSYHMLWLWGIWIPIAPNLLILNGVGLSAFAFFQQDKFFRSKINERLSTIKYTFAVIHNGPLQTLAYGLKHIRAQDIPQEKLIEQFEKLDREIRAIGDFLQLEALAKEEVLRLGSGLILDLNRPLHDLLYEVYSSTLERNDFEYFQTLKVKIRNFDPIDDKYLSREKKRSICLFLEEALCNVGKHAQGVKRVQASGEYFTNKYKLWVKDNGAGIKSQLENKGTKNCKLLAKQLKGEFKRESLSPKGTICELSWTLIKEF